MTYRSQADIIMEILGLLLHASSHLHSTHMHSSSSSSSTNSLVVHQRTHSTTTATCRLRTSYTRTSSLPQSATTPLHDLSSGESKPSLLSFLRSPAAPLWAQEPPRLSVHHLREHTPPPPPPPREPR
mmetsp:Transcript_12700/g.36798  ORF Transcript_12700/g.36798 Transcript_12700/m.36798 type:complete len:127 (+) Transcript_12700:736-1116(+)